MDGLKTPYTEKHHLTSKQGSNSRHFVHLEQGTSSTKRPILISRYDYNETPSYFY